MAEPYAKRIRLNSFLENCVASIHQTVSGHPAYQLSGCTKHPGIGLLTFSDGDCEPATKIWKTRVEYRIMNEKKSGL
jgi:hypothetical protein